MITFEFLKPRVTMAHLGQLPFWFDAADPRPARQQINSAYPFGGWRPFHGFTMEPGTHNIDYPGDPRMPPLAQGWLREELIILYPHDWVGIVQPDGTFEIARID
jgi:hypothetical protein